MDPSDPVPTPISALDAPLKNYDDMTSEERTEYDRLARKREDEEQAGWRLCVFQVSNHFSSHFVYRYLALI